MTSLRSAASATAFCALVIAAATPGAISARAAKPGSPRPTPTPTPVALQYDQITRMLMPAATAPPPGSFDESYQQLMAIADATPSPSPAHHGFSGLGGMLARGMMKHAIGAADSLPSMMAMMRDGSLERVTFYKKWVRTDLPLQHTATIEKCDRHETIYLDLAKKTYRVVKDGEGCGGATVTPAPMGNMPGNMTNMAPGTATMTLSTTQRDLGTKMLEGFRTHGTQARIAMTTTRATGSCHNGSSGMTIVRYISGIDRWRAYCPLPSASGMPPLSVSGAIDRGGCKPQVVTKGGAAVGLMSGGGKLALYRLMEMQAGSGESVGSLLERGNIRWLYRPEAKRLFSIPSDFTPAGS
ncbi:MAG: hypothetical protein HKL91_03765 [Candidatus Eremiobacteraeota bacterium]|nr:hypothetical protein [Candidatus Eremiobacteraeota bacterium]